MRHEIFPDVGHDERLASTDAVTTLNRKDRLRRWASLLEAHHGPMRALQRIEYLSIDDRHALRDEVSPIAVAYADPVLRAAGLRGDRLGDAIDFFGLTEDQAHHLLCDCHYHGAMTTQNVSTRLRAIADRRTIGEVWQSVRGWFAGRTHRSA